MIVLSDVELLTFVIDDGIQSVREAYPKPQDRQKLDGSVAGFEACRGTTTVQLHALLVEANQAIDSKRREGTALDFWWWRYRALQIEWTLNVLAASHALTGQPVCAPYTKRGLERAADILNIDTGFVE